MFVPDQGIKSDAEPNQSYEDVKWIDPATPFV